MLIHKLINFSIESAPLLWFVQLDAILCDNCFHVQTSHKDFCVQAYFVSMKDKNADYFKSPDLVWFIKFVPVTSPRMVLVIQLMQYSFFNGGNLLCHLL